MGGIGEAGDLGFVELEVVAVVAVDKRGVETDDDAPVLLDPAFASSGIDISSSWKSDLRPGWSCLAIIGKVVSSSSKFLTTFFF